MTDLPRLSAKDARTLLLDAQGLLADPTRRAGPDAVVKIVRALGFVQVDSIQRVERAHHLILGARLDAYRASHLEHATFGKRMLFEHWTHDASLIPVEWFHHWKPRFQRSDARLRASRWFSHRLRENADETIARVYGRVTKEGPLRSSDFERNGDRPSSGWWDWTPEKTALEFLWHTGRLAVVGRDQFQKIYDLTERVFPDAHALNSPTLDEHVEWACISALERLGVATPGELAAFWDAITIPQANAWCQAAANEGRIVALKVEALEGQGRPRDAFAAPDWRKRVRRAQEAPDRIRLLAPFDPIIRDRLRAQRLFGFDYRFEAFVPARKRKFGYYVMPMLEGDRLIGRVDPKHDRDRSVLTVDKVWWEPGIKATRRRKRELERAVGTLAQQIGADKVRIRRL